MKLTPEKLTAFCAALSETCNVGKACAAVGISRYTAYKWRKELPAFDEAWEEAMRVGVTALEDEAHRRAFEGVNKPLVHQGRFTNLVDIDGEPVLDDNGNPVVASTKEYSDTLAIFLLKAHAPEKYRENSRVELSGNLAVGSMSEDEIRAELAALVSAGVVPAGIAGGGDDDDVSDLV
jgi:hypothetical protein